MADDKRKVSINKERQVNTYAELWHTSWCLLKKGQDQGEGSVHQFRASLVFTAFSFEAYLNHIGPKIIPAWNRRSFGWKKKLDRIAQEIGLQIEYDKRPWAIIEELFSFRNEIAHGESIKVAKSSIVEIGSYEEYMHQFEETSWERFCTRQNAEQAREDVEAMVTALHANSGIKDELPFTSGWQDSLATLLEEEG